MLARLADEAPNERLIRHYVQEEIISRSDAGDKAKAIFEFRHIVGCLLAKVLVRQGWTLQRIADLRRSATVDQLVGYLPVRDRNRTEMLAQKFAKQRGAAEVPKPPPLPAPALHRIAEATLAQAYAPAVFTEPSAGGAPAVLRVELAPWCRIELEFDRLAEIEETEIEALAERFRSSLRRYRRGGGSK